MFSNLFLLLDHSLRYKNWHVASLKFIRVECIDNYEQAKNLLEPIQQLDAFNLFMLLIILARFQHALHFNLLFSK